MLFLIIHFVEHLKWKKKGRILRSLRLLHWFYLVNKRSSGINKSLIQGFFVNLNNTCT